MSLLLKMQQRLVQLIPTEVKEIGFKDQAYCLRIWYFGSDSDPDDVSFKLTVKTESLRKWVLLEKGTSAPHYLWCADELESGVGVHNQYITDKTVMSLHKKWSKETFGGSGLPTDDGLEDLRRMIQQVAVELNRLDWQQYCPVSDDFVVVPADGSHTYSDDHGELKASVSEDRIKLLRDMGYLGKTTWCKLP